MASGQIPTFSVSDFVALVNQTLEYAYPTVVVEGEVASFKVSQGKWVFFDLKDDTASVGCFMSLYNLRQPIEDGMKVVIRATTKLTNWGKFSLTVQSIRPVGEGNLKRSFELLKSKLEAEGLFSSERKRSLPEIPDTIAVISSTGAAGYTDFIKILGDRWGGVRVDVADVQVQGDVAAEQIIRAIEYMNSRTELADVLVIVRGGGSADDLAVFNDERLVRAIAASRIPTLVGVGHEIDVTLADLAADRRAATPSNAAEIVVPDHRAVLARVRSQMNVALSSFGAAVDVRAQDIKAGLYGALESIEDRLMRSQDVLTAKRRVLTAYNPESVLARGYAIVHGDPSPGHEIYVEQSDKIITAEVTDVKGK